MQAKAVCFSCCHCFSSACCLAFLHFVLFLGYSSQFCPFTISLLTKFVPFIFSSSCFLFCFSLNRFLLHLSCYLFLDPFFHLLIFNCFPCSCFSFLSRLPSRCSYRVFFFSFSLLRILLFSLFSKLLISFASLF